MQTLAKLTEAVLATSRAAPSRNVPLPAPVGQPPLLDKTADYEIPNRVWCNWHEDGKPRMIRRALTDSERAIVQRRNFALECGLLAFTGADVDVVDTAIDAMFAGFRSMRQDGDASGAITEVTRAVLREFPAWAIVKGCLKIARNEAGLDPKWPPNDAQVHQVVAGIVESYRGAFKNAQALLDAPVEPPAPVRLTRAELEAKLGRPLTDAMAKVSGLPPAEPCDGKHALRVAAELEARRKGREAPE